MSGQLALFELAAPFEQLSIPFPLSTIERTPMNHSYTATVRRARARLARRTFALGSFVSAVIIGYAHLIELAAR